VRGISIELIEGILVSSIYDMIKYGGTIGTKKSKKKFEDIFRESLRATCKKYRLLESDLDVFFRSKEVEEHLRLHLKDKKLDFHYLGRELINYIILGPNLSAIMVLEDFFETLRANLLSDNDFREQLKDHVQTEIRENVMEIAAIKKQEMKKDLIIIEEQKAKMINSIFINIDDKFRFLIERNFLYKFDKSDSPNYFQLLSNDFKRLFFKLFNRNCILCISGREGVGKTFNTLLICKKLQQEGYHIYYQSVRKAGLSENIFSNLIDLEEKYQVFVIDDCQFDIEKTKSIIEKIANTNGYTKRFKLIFLTRPLDITEMRDVYGKEIPILEYKAWFNDLESLAKLFFHKINLANKFPYFLSSLKKEDLSEDLFKYRNMEFWNEFFCYIEVTHKFESDIKQSDFYKSAYEFFVKREPRFIKDKEAMAKLLPFFTCEIPIHANYLKNLQIDETQFRRLLSGNVVDSEVLDWDNDRMENDSAKFIVSKLHPTKARILGIILEKYEGIELTPKKTLINYMDWNWINLYRIITPLYFYDREMLREMLAESHFLSILKKYLKERHPGKHLDRVMRSFSGFDPQLKDKLLDDDVMEILAKKCNDKTPWLISKSFLLMSVYKINPSKAYYLYKKIEINNIIDRELMDPDKGLRGFLLFIEVSKNLLNFYLFSIGSKFREEFDNNLISENLRKVFNDNGYLLPANIIIEKAGIYSWNIISERVSYNIAGRRGLNVFLFSDNDNDRRAYIFSNTEKILDLGFGLIINKIEKSIYFTQFHWLLKRLDGMKFPNSKISLANYFINKVPPEKMVDWMKYKNTRINELRFVFKIARFTTIKINGMDKNLYHDYFKNMLEYADIQKIFDNYRSQLYDISITSKFGHEILAEYLYQYSQEDGFIKKVNLTNNLFIINESMSLVKSNPTLSYEHKKYIISRIINAYNFEERMIKATIKKAKILGKKNFNIDKEKERFSSFKKEFLEK
jgi:hypothetical protein